MKTACAMALLCAALHAAPGQLAQTIPLPGLRGRIDHMAVDTAGKRLFAAAVGNNTLEIVDLKRGRIIHSIRNLSEPQGVAYAPKSNRIYVAGGGDGWIRIIDGASYALIKTLDMHSDADNLRYDSVANRMYVGYGGGGIAAIDADSEKVIFNINLPAHPEAFAVDVRGRRVFANLPDAGEIALLDLEKKIVISHWPLGNLKANFPIAFDAAHRRLVAGFRNPPVMAVFDAETGKKIFQTDIDVDADDIHLDAAGRRVFISCGSGWLDVFSQKDGDHYARVKRMATARGARTSLWVPGWNRLYVAAPAGGGKRAEIRVYDF
jgi:DNA-binding beta-propeller fold protein YncE